MVLNCASCVQRVCAVNTALFVRSPLPQAAVADSQVKLRALVEPLSARLTACDAATAAVAEHLGELREAHARVEEAHGHRLTVVEADGQEVLGQLGASETAQTSLTAQCAALREQGARLNENSEDLWAHTRELQAGLRKLREQGGGGGADSARRADGAVDEAVQERVAALEAWMAAGGGGGGGGGGETEAEPESGGGLFGDSDEDAEGGACVRVRRAVWWLVAVWWRDRDAVAGSCGQNLHRVPLPHPCQKASTTPAAGAATTEQRAKEGRLFSEFTGFPAGGARSPMPLIPSYWPRCAPPAAAWGGVAEGARRVRQAASSEGGARHRTTRRRGTAEAGCSAEAKRRRRAARRSGWRAWRSAWA